MVKRHGFGKMIIGMAIACCGVLLMIKFKFSLTHKKIFQWVALIGFALYAWGRIQMFIMKRRKNKID